MRRGKVMRGSERSGWGEGGKGGKGGGKTEE